LKRVAPAAKIHGGKFYLAPKIIALFPPRQSYINYVEDYCGIASVLLAHDPEGKSEIINDINGDTTNFFDVLKRKNEFNLFERMVALTPFSELQFEASLSRLESGINLQAHERAFHFFVVCRQSRSGDRKQFATITKNRLRKRMNEQVSAWLGGIETLVDVHQRLQRVLIRNVPALQLLEEFNNDKTVHYLDPPYHPESRVDKDAYGEYDTTAKDHEELIKAVKKSRSKILLSGYHCDLYDTELKKWDLVEIISPNHVSGQQSKRRMVECVWKNY
jgi:DNA adenine methylase